MNKLSWWKTISLLCFSCAVAAIGSPAQTFKTLFNFDVTNGWDPNGVLIQGTDGNFYGITTGGGTGSCIFGCGTIFKITPGGVLTTLYSFNNSDGSYPQGGLVQGTDGNFYGTTAEGGDLSCGYEGAGCGTVFKVTPSGNLTTLHNFNGSDGENPQAVLVQGTDGSFYGTTVVGGASGDGTVFKITSGGKLTTLHSFDGSDGVYSYGGLVQATDGNFYGTTFGGGASNDGTVFKITAGGKLTTLHSFDLTDGHNPEAALVQATNGDFYGTTTGGGTFNAARSSKSPLAER
jgi:uncharacterized repeat protein (TIGR03803 family)